MWEPGRRPATVVAGDVDSWLAACEPGLQRTAFLLAGDPAGGRHLLRPVLARICADWSRVGADEADDRARELLLAEHRRTWGSATPEPSAVSLAGYDDPGVAAWALVTAVSPRIRAVVVLRFHERLDPVDAARLLRLPSATVRADERSVLDALEDHHERLRREGPARTLPRSDRLLTDTLHDRGEQTAYDPTPLDQVHAAAAHLRARRRTARVVGVGAVAGVLVAALVAAAALVDAPRDEPLRRPTSSGVRAPFGPLGSIERAGLPEIPFLVENVFHDPDGGRVELPVEHPRAAVPYGGDLWVTERYIQVTDTLHRVDAGGREVASWPTAGDPVVSADGSSFAWVEAPRRDGQGYVIHSRGRRQDVGRRAVLAGIIDDRIVFNGAGGRLGRVWITDLRTPPRRIPGLAGAEGVEPHDGLVSGFDRDGYGAVVDVDTGRVLWRSANVRPTLFSPDGHHVVAYGATRSRIVNAVLSAHSGENIVPIDLTGRSPGVLDVRWEDDEHVLLIAVEQGESAFLRAGLDGTVVRAGPPMPGDPVGASRYRFASR